MAAALRRAVAVAERLAPAYRMRRFLQERPASRPAVPPDCGFMPLADRIRDHLGVSSPRINLNGLMPPAPPAEAAVSLTVEEARKVLRAMQMEAARTRVGAAGEGTVPYAEFLRLFCDSTGVVAGPSVARALDESRSVIVLGKTVFLRPEMAIHMCISWLRFWAIIHKPVAQEVIGAVCDKLNMVVRELFTTYGWRFDVRITDGG